MAIQPEIPLSALDSVGEDLKRPECVLCNADGDVYVSDWDGGVCHIGANGTQRRILARNASPALLPNGIALRRDGTFLLANLGDAGGVWSLAANGDHWPFLTAVDNETLPPTNFVLVDNQERVWITVSTRIEPRARAYRPDACDGFIVLVDHRGARIVADGLGYTNEVQIHPSGDWLYVNETFARRTSRMRVGGDGSLGSRETVTEYGRGTYPDGLYFDENGGFWVVSLVSNRVLRIGRDGEKTLMIEDQDTNHVDWVENAFQNGQMGREHLDRIGSEKLRNTSSIAFGGPDRRLSYLGCLLGNRIVQFESPFKGVKPAHWHWRMA